MYRESACGTVFMFKPQQCQCLQTLILEIYFLFAFIMGHIREYLLKLFSRVSQVYFLNYLVDVIENESKVYQKQLIVNLEHDQLAFMLSFQLIHRIEA